jgi:hypothetical protein
MTRLPVESWHVVPRFDIPSYELNTVCPITGEAFNLEDHHIFRRSFMAIGKENLDLYWVEYFEGNDLENLTNPWENEGHIVKNRVALSPEAHHRITTNQGRLEYRGAELWYLEGDEEKLLDLNLRLMEGTEKVSKRRKKASTPEERRARVNFSIRTPDGEEQIIPELVQQGREAWGDALGWSEDVPAHFVVVTAFAKALQGGEA